MRGNLSLSKYLKYHNEVTIMKKIIAAVIMCFILVCLLFSCGYVGDESSLAICASFSIPGMPTYDLKGTETVVRLVESDSEGRSLFEYTTFNSFSGKRETALVICQKFTDKEVYFYENVNFIIGEYDKDKVDDLKSRNDWNQPYDYTKISSRKIEVSFDLVNMSAPEVNYKSLKSAISDELDTSDGEIAELFFFDMNSSGQSIYCLITENVDCTENWLVFVDDSYSVTLSKIDAANLAEELKEFKKTAGWVYQ